MLGFDALGSEPLGSVSTDVPAPGGEESGSNYIRCTLATRDGALHVSLGELRWALFAQLSPSEFGAPVAKGAHTMTAGSALFEVEVPASDVPDGWYMLVLADIDGTTTLACPVMVS